MQLSKTLWSAAVCVFACLCTTAPAAAQSGACCFDDGGGGDCQVTASEADCTNLGGCFAGVGTDCMTTECQWQNYFLFLDQGTDQLTFNKFDQMGGQRILEKVIVKIEGQSDHLIEQTLLAQRQTCVLESETEADMRIDLSAAFKDVIGIPTLNPILYVTPLFGGGDVTFFCGDPFNPPGPMADMPVLCPPVQTDPSCNNAPPGCPITCNYGGNFGFMGADDFMAMTGDASLAQFVSGPGNMTFRVNILGDAIFVAPVTFAAFSNPVNEAEGPVVVIYIFSPRGACCLPNGTCIDNISEDDCNQQNGTYQGDGTICLPTGACCLPDDSCVDVSETCCDDLGGTFLGGACSPNTGACCFPDGTCVEMNETCCVNDGGTFIGGACSPNSGACCLPNGTCINVSETCCVAQGGQFVGGQCDPTVGACCFADGTCIETTATCCVATGGTFIGGNCSPNSGACCLPNGTCIDVNETCCINQGGIFIGGNCSPSSGACCLPNGTCINVNETCCINQGGTFLGGACSPNSGACCLPNGTCINVNETCCIDQGGTFIGGTCSPNSGACCLPNGTCINVNETCCVDQGGTFIGGTCSPNSGACCLPNGTCINVNETCCVDQGGTFIGGACSPNTGACCLPDGSCVNINETCCVDQGGAFLGGVCGPDGACCLPNGTCVVTSQACCTNLGGDFQGGGSVCGGTGACCLPNGTCIVTSEACCLNQNGTYVGDGTTCGSSGACCLPNGTCEIQIEACCILAGGDFVGPGTACGDTGACCFPDGSCSVEIQACCAVAGGNFIGAGTVCGPQGACCLPDGTCVDDEFEACCEAVGGTFQGAGSTCATINCVPEDGGCWDKGSLVIFSKIEIRWDAAGNLLQDTFLQLTNDYPSNVTIQMYFINGDPPLAANPTTGERAHPGWNWVDNKIQLTADQPTYWSALTGLGGNGPHDPTFSPFTVLDPGFPPGRPDVEVPGERYLRGFIVAWAVDSVTNEEIRWNHLAGIATLVHYRDGYAWEYRTCGVPVVANVGHGQPSSIAPNPAGELHLDGSEYRAAAAELLLNFQAAGSAAFSGPVLVSTTTDVTLHLVSTDLRQETDGPVTTKAHYSVWNMNEGKLSGAFRCITCWDQTLLVNYGIPNHFTLVALQTDHGKARIDGLASALCDRDLYGPGGPGTPPDGVLDVVSQAAALTGLTARLMTVDGGINHAADGTNLFDLGAENAVIKYDVQSGPPENFDIPSSPASVDRLMRKLTGELPGIYPGQ